MVVFLRRTFSCQSHNQIYTTDLVIIEQVDSIRGGYEENNYCWASFNVDGPVNGSQVLVDSVMAFLNKKMCCFCEWCAHESILYEDERWVKSFSTDEVFTNDGELFLENYIKNIDLSFKTAFGANSLEWI